MEATLKRIREAGDYAVIRYDKLITTPPKNWINKKKQQHKVNFEPVSTGN